MSRLLLLIVLACATLGFAACGEKEETVTKGESEAVYVTNGEIQYQVQLSRQLDQFSAGDRDLLKGVPAAERRLAPDEIWFGVWIRAQNGSETVQPMADEFVIRDTTGREFKPVDLDGSSPFAYRPVALGADGVYPLPGSASGQSPTTGAFLIFRMPVSALDFRPLELEFGSSKRPARVSSVRLDV